jgi:hypothetical protein
MAKQNRDQQAPGNAPRRNEPQQPREPQPERKEQEKVRGGMSSDQPQKRPIQRQPGRMPLPD